MGYGTAQGSSSRGGLRGLAVMAKRIEEGKDCAFTIDGRADRATSPSPARSCWPAKPAPRSWSSTSAANEAPRSRKRGTTSYAASLQQTVMIFAPPIEVPPDADAALLESKHAECKKNWNASATRRILVFTYARTAQSTSLDNRS